MRAERGVVVVVWGWVLATTAVIFGAMVYSGMLDGAGRALFEMAKDILRFLID